MFGQLLVSGIAIGATYALIALAMVIIYKASEVLNFAQGDMAMLSAFVAFMVLDSFQLGFWVAFPLALAFAFVLGAFLEFCFLRRAKDPNVLGLIIITLGLEMVLFGVASMIWGADQKDFAFPVSDFDVIEFKGRAVVEFLSLTGLVVAVVAIFGLVATWFVLARRFNEAAPEGASRRGDIGDRRQGIRLLVGMLVLWGLAAAVGVGTGLLISPAQGGLIIGLNWIGCWMALFTLAGGIYFLQYRKGPSAVALLEKLSTRSRNRFKRLIWTLLIIWSLWTVLGAVFSWQIGIKESVVVSHLNLVTLGVAISLMLLLFLFFRYTKTGVAMKATQQNMVAARIMGIRVNRILMLTWGMSAMVGAIAAFLIAPTDTLEPYLMWTPQLKGFSAAVLGGMTSLPGAVGGGFLLGVIENLFGGYVSVEFKSVVAFAVIVLVLCIKPSGLFARHYVRKV